jgi:hypothetical protein
VRKPGQARALDQARKRLRQFQRARGLDPETEDDKRTDEKTQGDSPQLSVPMKRSDRGEAQ